MIAAVGGGATRTISAGSYDIRLGAGLLAGFAAQIAEIAPAHRYAVITDSNVKSLYAGSLVSRLEAHGGVSLHTIPAGEEHKTRDTWSRITDELLDAGCARDTTVVALGGGVVGDLAGFVAATFMRGVPVIQCPTTLLAMIDASVGGKTGVDTTAGKNLVGAFHAPSAVLMDVDVLRTLPAEQRRSGLAEAIKHGVIADARYFAELGVSMAALVAGDAETMLHAVARSVEIKASVVRNDVRELGLRKTLNFGHTLGHAIEHVSGYSILHGYCVAIGMVLEARIAERIQVAQPGTSLEISRVLIAAGLPVEIPDTIDRDLVLVATRRDKKVRGGSVEYSLPSRVGAMADNDSLWAVRVDDETVRAVLA